MAGGGTDKVLLWDRNLWLDSIYPTTVLPECLAALVCCRKALQGQGKGEGTMTTQIHHCMVGMQKITAVIHTLGPALAFSLLCPRGPTCFMEINSISRAADTYLALLGLHSN